MDFEDTATDLKTVDEKGLSLVSKLASLQLTLEQQVAQLEEDLKQAKRSLREIAEEQLPSAMAEHSISELVLEDGSRVSVGKFYSASISKDKADEAFGWLIANDFGDLIKNQVATNMAVNTKKWVEPMTLKAFVKDQFEQGNNVPAELFGLYIGEKSKITKPKKG